jgi:hypothetical protein
MPPNVNKQPKQHKNNFEIFSTPKPELTEEQTSIARSVKNKSWILSHMGHENLGRFGMLEGFGFALQCVDSDVLRCIFAFDDKPAILSLAMVKETIESVGGTLEIGDFTVLKEYVEPENPSESGPKNSPAGMEVA